MQKPVSKFLDRNPRNLLVILSVVALVSIAIILSLSSYGVYEVYSRQVIDNAEEDAVHTSLALIALDRDLFLHLTENGSWKVKVSTEDYPLLDGRLRRFLKPFRIVKIKVFDREGSIVYSTDPSVVGRLDAANPRLSRALLGFYDSELETKESVLDLAEEEIIDVDVVETYVPIMAGGGEVVGAFEIYRDVTRYRTEIAQVVLQISGVLGLILLTVFGASFVVVQMATREIETSHARLKEMATYDPLTGTLNRREVLKRASDELSRITRSQKKDLEKSLGIVMLDIDHFKKINDTYGHFKGDEVLKGVSAIMKESVRGYDLVGRFGGEEFLLLLPGVNLEGAKALAERIRLSVKGEIFESEGQRFHITVSLGVAIAHGGEEGFRSSLRLADEALYLAKNAGRDRVETLESQPLHRKVVG